MTKASEELRDILQVFQDENIEIDNVELIVNTGAVSQAVPNPPDDGGGGTVPPDEEDNKIWHTLKLKGSGHVPVNRTPTTEEVRQRSVNALPGTKVFEDTPPKKIHSSKVWEDETDLLNVMKEWAWLPKQTIQNVNMVFKTLPFDFPDRTGKNDPPWQGCFIERKYLA